MSDKEIRNILRDALRDLRRSDAYRASMFAKWRWGNAKVYGTVAIVSNCAAGNHRVTIESDSDGETHIVY